MAVNVWSLGTASGNFLVTGLPYASNNVGGTSNEQWIGSASSSSINFGSYDLWSVVPYITQSSSQIQFFMNSISGDVNVVATSTATFNSPSALDLRIYIAYETA
jgi:hypothetical protein